MELNLMKQPKDSKRILCLSGGGSHGAWQAGVISHLMSTNYEYDGISGVSVGAINGGWMSLAGSDPLKRQTLAKALISHWDQVTTRKVRKKWFLWPLSLLWKPSVYDSSPLEGWIKDLFKTAKGELGDFPFRCGVVSMESGEYLSLGDNVEDILASASYPGFLTPVELEGLGACFDGGVRHNSPVGDAIEMGATHIDVVLCSTPGVGKANPTKTIPTLLRALSIMQDQNMVSDLKTCMHINQYAHRPDNDYRRIHIRVLTPGGGLKGDVLSFEQKDVQPNIALGIKDGHKLRAMPYKV